MTIIHETYKYIILESVIESKTLREKLSFKEHVDLCNHVNTLSKNECDELISELGVPEFQSKFKNALKYGLAAIAGGIIAPAGISIVLGATVGMFTRYLFRKASDPCWQACVKQNADHKNICKYVCYINGCDSVIRDISNQMGKCSRTKNPERCRTRLEKQKLTWMKKREDYKDKLQQEQDKISKSSAEEKLKQKEIDAKMSKANEAREHLKSIVMFSDKLKQRTTFKEQIDILNWVYDAPSYRILNIAEAWDDPPPIPSAPVKTALKIGFAVTAVVLPGGLILQQLASFLIDSYDHDCQKQCHERSDIDNKSLCYRQCKLKSLTKVTAAIATQYKKCDNTKKPIKCRQKLRSLMTNYRKKQMEAKMRLERAIRKDREKRIGK